MAKITLDDLASLVNETSAVATINANSALIETAIENTLSRDGTSPNTMGADLDMNSNDIINIGKLYKGSTDLAATPFVWTGDWTTATAYTINELVEHNGSSYVALSSHTSGSSTEPGVGGSWESVWDLVVSKGDTGDTGAPGDVQGPATSTDNAVARWDGTDGVTLQNSAVTIDDSGNIVTAGTAATGALTVTGNIAVTGTVDGRDIATDGTKLDGIEAGAEVNDTAAEILTKLLTVDGAGSGLDADLLDGNSSAAFQTADSTLTALAAYNTNGLITQTAADTFAGRTITGTANEVTVTNGDGVSGNPTLSLPATIDLGGKTSLEIPNSAAPTVTTTGQIGIDTSVTDFSHGILKFNSGEELAVIAVPIAELSGLSNGDGIFYNATNDEFEIRAPTGGGGDVELANSGTISSQATLDIVLTSFTSYRTLMLMLNGVVPATSGVDLWIRFSTDGGSTYATTLYNYSLQFSQDNDIAVSQLNDTAAGAIVFATEVGNATTDGYSGQITLPFQTSTALYPRIYTTGTSIRADDAVFQLQGGGARTAAQDVDAIRIMASSGNLTSGTWALYGYN